MERNEKSVSELRTELESLSITLLLKRFGGQEKGLGFAIVVLASELQRGTIGSRIPRSLRNRSFVSFQARQFAEKNGRNPTFAELLALVA